MTREEWLLKMIDHALSAAKDMRNTRGREADAAWTELTDRLLDMRTRVRKRMTEETPTDEPT